MMRKAMLGVLAILLGLAASTGCAQVTRNVATASRPSPADIAAARQEVQDACQNALSALYAVQLSSRREIEQADGYAAFSTFGMKLMQAGDTSGRGIAKNNLTSSQTFMKMSQARGDLGLEGSSSQLIFVFTSEGALFNFIHKGWGFGDPANTAVMAGGQGRRFAGATQVAPDVYLYQITETGLSATPAVGNTRFLVDSDLN